jgi:hypothetical protein
LESEFVRVGREGWRIGVRNTECAGDVLYI